MAIFLDIDGSVERINAKITETIKNLRGMAGAYDDVNEATTAAVNGGVKGQKSLTDSASKTTKALKGQTNIVEQLEGHLKRLEKGQRKATDPTLVKKYNTEIVKTRAALQAVKTTGTSGLAAVNAGAKASTVIFRGLQSTIATTFAPLIAAGAIASGITEVIRLTNEYEQIAADLQAITGANGDTLEFLKQSAVEVGLETTVSAGQTLEAYKLIASAKPELLSNAEGLAAITREAVTLTEAMGGDLPTAATNLTDIMNQFNAPAEQSSRFVNALAAGSKEGSADVGQLAAAILVAGTEAKSSNVSFEESVGLLEVMAEKGKKGAEAGTGLRNVLSKLSATDILPEGATKRLEAAGVDIDALSDKSKTFTERLEALAPVQNDANALTAVFGLENKATAQILLQNIDRANELTAAVTGTNTAYEQAAIRTGTASAEFAKLKNTIVALVQEGEGGGLGRLLAFIVRFVRQGLLFFRDRLKDLRPAFEPVVTAVQRLFSAISRLLPETRNAEGATNAWGKAVKVLNVPLKVIFALVSALVNAVAAVWEGFADLIGQSPVLGRALANIRNGISAAFDAFILLPAFVAGGLAAIKTFVVEGGRAIGQFGRNVGSVIKEAFSFGKLIKEGIGSLQAAVSELLTNPFEGVGAAAADAFKKEFDAAKEPVEIPVKTVSTEIGTAPERGTGGGSEPADFIDPEAAAKEAEKAAKERARIEEDIARTKLAAMKDGVEKELALEQARFDDLMQKLEQYGLDSTEAVQQHEQNKFDIRSRFIAGAADLEGLSGEERIAFLHEQAKREIDALEAGLRDANGGELAAEQAAQINLLRKKASEEYLAQLEKFQDEEQQKAQAHEIALLELQAGNFEELKDFETFKQEEILKIRLKYAEAQLALIEQTQGAESDAALALRGTINSIKGELEGLAAVGNTAEGFNVYKLLGIDPNNPENAAIIKGIEDATKATIDSLTQINELRLKSAEAAIQAADDEINAIQEKIDAKEAELEEERDLSDQGFANFEEDKLREIEALKAQQAAEKEERDKALAEKKKIQKQQAIIDTITQGSSLITAAAQIFQSVAAIPFVGVAIGAALVAAMLGSFVAAKAKVFQNINSQKAEKGMTGVITGRRHSQGGERFGDHIEVEAGERFGILSRAATRRHGKAFEAFTNAANKGQQKEMARIAALLGGTRVDRDIADVFGEKEAQIVQFRAEFSTGEQTRELRENNRLLRAILAEQAAPNKSTEFTGAGKISRMGNSTRIVRRKNG